MTLTTRFISCSSLYIASAKLATRKLTKPKSWRLWAAASTLFLVSFGEVAANLLYEDTFSYDSSQTELPVPWKSVWPNQWIQDGWLYNHDTDGWPRDSQAVLHDADPSWQNYQFNATVEILGPWTDATLFLRSQGFSRSSGGSGGRAYQLNFADYSIFGPNFGNVNRAVLSRTDCTSSPCINIELANVPLTLANKGPFDVMTKLIDGNIQVSVNGIQVIEITDSDPITYGGIGIHNIWETKGRYDNFQVVSLVPLPASAWLFISYFAMWMGLKRRTSGN